MTNDTSVPTEGVDVLVIGGGQAGLAVGIDAAHLADRINRNQHTSAGEKQLAAASS
jgi:hypothetical protein